MSITARRERALKSALRLSIWSRLDARQSHRRGALCAREDRLGPEDRNLVAEDESPP